MAIHNAVSSVPHWISATGLSLVLMALASPAGAISSRTLVTATSGVPFDYFGLSVSGAGDVNGDGYADFIVGASSDDTVGPDAGRACVYYGGPGADATADLVLTGEAAGDRFGQSVSDAGDVNGDGYGDVIVGAHGVGRAYVFFGGLGTDAVADMTMTGEAASDFFGISVSGAGDVNGDGFDDVIVGARLNDAGGSNAGRAYVYYGGPGADAIADLTLTGEAADDEFGLVSGAGDVNGDGYADVIVGAHLNDTGGINAGRAYVYYGGPGVDATADLVLNSEAAGDNFGWSVAGAGDVNGDGYADVIVGAYDNSTGGTGAGRAYVYYGGPVADAAADLTLTGDLDYDALGFSVSGAGDVNGDGYDDVVVGAPTDGFAGLPAGRAYVYFGGSGPDAVADIVFTGESASQLFSWSVSGAGDVNGDGYADVIVGVGPVLNPEGAAYVYAIYPYEVLSPNGGEQWVAGKISTVRWLGHDPASLAISYDGGSSWSTLAIGIGGQDENQYTLTTPAATTQYAKVRLSYTGQSATRSTSDASDGVFSIVPPHDPPAAAAVLHLTATGEAADDQLGGSVSGAGDVNGDGYADVIVGAYWNDAGGSDAGRAYVYYGGPWADAVADLTLTGEAADDHFGAEVSGAGDFDGDGYADVIVGAPWNGAGGAYAGRAYIFYGGPQGDAVADLTLTGEAASDQFGVSVSGAGDVNGDGYADVIVGAFHNDAGGVSTDDRGRAYVYYGGPFADATADLTLTGEAAGDALGISVSGAGDVNGDGYADLIVGAYQNDAGGSGAGRAYVYYGGPGADAVADLTLTGEAPFDQFGQSVAGAGDVNGDDYADLIVGAHTSHDDGRAYVYYGGPGADAVPDLTLTGDPDGDVFGYSVSGAGDVNRDGYADLIVGDDLNGDGGHAYVFYGGPGADAVADLTWSVDSGGDRFGRSVSGAGDMNGDGFSDVIVGAYWNDAGGTDAGRAYVFDLKRYHLLAPNGGESWNIEATKTISWLGSEVADIWLSVDGGKTYDMLKNSVGGAGGNSVQLQVPTAPTESARIKIAPADPSIGGSDASDGVFRIVVPHDPPAAAHQLALTTTGEAALDLSGTSVSGAGDVNGDGYADVVVGVPGHDAGGSAAGRAYVYHGGPGSDAVADLTLTGEAAGDGLGGSVAGAGDVNGDGYADVIVGAYLNDAGGTSAGRAYVYYGGPGADAVADLTLTGEAAGDNFGYSVSGAGDVNGDGYADVIVGAQNNDAGGSNAGRAYVYFGGPGADATADLVLTGEAASDEFGRSVSGAGDVNGDSFTDVIVGALENGAGGNSAGRAYVYYGGPGADAVADLTLTGEASAGRFGVSVSSAGDVNGDGYADVVVGAYFLTANRAYVYYGGPGADVVADLVLTGEAANDWFGRSVSGAGDVNRDGYADVMVGAPMNAAGGSDAGRAYLYYGGPGVDAVADVTLTGEAAGDNFGYSVSGAGDGNGDGFSDIIVGAYLNDVGGSNAGRVYLYDCNRYFVTAPNGGETWNVGAAKDVSWLGAEVADVWLSVNGGEAYALLESGVGGAASNVVPIQVPHAPTKFGKIRITPSDPSIGGRDESDSLFTIQTSVALLALLAAPAPNRVGAAVITWSTDPGPADLAGYRLEKTLGNDSWRTVVSLTKETSYTDEAAGAGGVRYRLFAVNGLNEELLLGETSLRPLNPLSAWPLPYRGGDLTLTFATYGGLGGGRGVTEVSVFDVSGRLVRTVARGAYGAGYQTAVWNGRDTAGRRVPTGIYFIRAQSAGQVKTLKLAVLR